MHRIASRSSLVVQVLSASASRIRADSGVDENSGRDVLAAGSSESVVSTTRMARAVACNTSPAPLVVIILSSFRPLASHAAVLHHRRGDYLGCNSCAVRCHGDGPAHLLHPAALHQMIGLAGGGETVGVCHGCRVVDSCSCPSPAPQFASLNPVPACPYPDPCPRSYSWIRTCFWTRL
jgi:hypothetical protein